MNKIICFDVDGVLIDSKNEILVSSWNEYNLWLNELGLPSSSFAYSIEDIPADWLNVRKELSKHSNKGYHRVAINPIILSKFNPTLISSNIIHELSEIDPELKKKTMNRVKKVRTDLSKSECYPSLIKKMVEVNYEWIEKMHDAKCLFFVTNNPFSIAAFSSIAFTPNTSQVRTIAGSVHNKVSHINKFEATIDSRNILFIDDRLPSLREVSEGSNLEKSHIIQNSRAPEGTASEFNVLDFDEIISVFSSL